MTQQEYNRIFHSTLKDTYKMATKQANNNDNQRNVILRNVELHWCNFDKTTAPFGDEIWSCAVMVPKKRAKELEPFGKVKTVEGGKVSINLKKKAIKANGEPAMRIVVVDGAKREMSPKSIGNGSIGNVMLLLRDYEIKGPTGKVTKSGTSTMLTKVQITELIKYEPKAGMDFDSVDSDDDDNEESSAKSDDDF